MIPIKQDIVGSKYANCLQACVASILDKPLNLVPNFMLFGKEYWEALYLYIRSIGFIGIAYVYGLPPNDSNYHIISLDFGKEFDHSHCAIYKNGTIIHDPHPKGVQKDDLDKIIGYYQIMK